MTKKVNLNLGHGETGTFTVTFGLWERIKFLFHGTVVLSTKFTWTDRPCNNTTVSLGKK